MLGSIAGTPVDLDPGTPEADAFARLHSRSGAEDAGEHSVISYAFVHQEVTAVLFDRRALFRGVEELRGRVLSLHGFLHVLRTQHSLATGDADDISRKICASKNIVQPLWW